MTSTTETRSSDGQPDHGVGTPAAGWSRIARARVALEIRLFRRQPQQIVFSLAYPVLMMVIFGSVFGERTLAGGVTFPQYFLAGIAATGIMLTSFQSVAIGIAHEREIGLLPRLRLLGTPPIAYFLGKAGLVLLTTVAQLTVLLLVASLAFDVPLPTEPDRWVTFAWVTTAGALAGTVLGVAVASAVSSAAAAVSGVTAFAVVLQFFSGVFFVFSELPPWMQQVSSMFPLRWMTLGMRSVFLPDEAAAVEAGGGWQHPLTATVLLLWVVVGALLCHRTFRWSDTD